MNKEKQHILFLSPYPEGTAPSQRLKFEQYFQFFKESGYEIKTNSFVSKKLWKILYKDKVVFKKFFLTLFCYLKRLIILPSISKYNIVYIHLWVTPFGSPVFERLVHFFAKKIVYDIDDMVYLGHTSKANNKWRLLKGPKKINYLMKVADHVITSTKAIDEYTHRFNQNTTEISCTVDTLNRYQCRAYNENKKVIIGWSGSHSTIQYLEPLKPVFQSLAKKYDFKLLIMGAQFVIEGVDVECIEWTADIEVETLQKFDIGLYPLPNEEWALGKSGGKAIQYMATGIPIIATGIGANLITVKDGETGILVPPDNYDEWEKKIELLINASDLREKLGKAGRQTIVEKYSVEANKEKYLNVFKEVIKK